MKKRHYLSIFILNIIVYLIIFIHKNNENYSRFSATGILFEQKLLILIPGGVAVISNVKIKSYEKYFLEISLTLKKSNGNI